MIYDDISVGTLGKENYYFPLNEEGKLEEIDYPFMENPIFDTNNEEIGSYL